MAVFKHQSAWRAQVYLKGRCVASQAGFPTKAKAQAWHDETKVKLRGAPPKAEATWEDLVSRFETWHLPTVSARTRELYELEIRARLTPHFQFMRLERIDEPAVEALKAKLRESLQPASANNCLDVLGLMLGKAVRWKLLAERGPTVEPFPEPMKSYKWWDEREHISRFLRASERSRYYAFYLTALETGLRLGELLGLSKADIDFETGMIRVWRQWTPKRTYTAPKHDKERWVSFEPSGHLAEVLRRAVQASPHPEAIFVTAKGSRPIRARVSRDYLRALIKKAGVPLITMHSLRHTYASWFMREVGDIWALKAILGHADIQTTMRYAHHAKRQRLPVLGLAQRVTHNPHTGAEVMELTEKNDRGKDWCGYTDSKRIDLCFAA